MRGLINFSQKILYAFTSFDDFLYRFELKTGLVKVSNR